MRVALETHRYAPELNKAFLAPKGVQPTNGSPCIPCPGALTLGEVRRKLFKPVVVRRVVRLKATHPQHECVTDTRQGPYTDLSMLRSAIDNFKARHNMPGTVFEFKTWLVG